VQCFSKDRNKRRPFNCDKLNRRYNNCRLCKFMHLNYIYICNTCGQTFCVIHFILHHEVYSNVKYTKWDWCGSCSYVWVEISKYLSENATQRTIDVLIGNNCVTYLRIRRGNNVIAGKYIEKCLMAIRSNQISDLSINTSQGFESTNIGNDGLEQLSNIFKSNRFLKRLSFLP
jgi:hypothetical protein